MEKIIISVVIVGLFIFFVYFLMKIYKKDKSKKEDAPIAKATEPEKEEIPAILKEITMGNYMHDMSNISTDEIQMEEDSSIKMPEVSEIKKIEKAFDDISDISVEIEDDELIDIDEDVNEDDEVTNETETKQKSLIDEYKGLSKDMKTLIIANILEKKNK